MFMLEKGKISTYKEIFIGRNKENISGEDSNGNEKHYWTQ